MTGVSCVCDVPQNNRDYDYDCDGYGRRLVDFGFPAEFSKLNYPRAENFDVYFREDDRPH